MSQPPLRPGSAILKILKLLMPPKPLGLDEAAAQDFQANMHQAVMRLIPLLLCVNCSIAGLLWWVFRQAVPPGVAQGWLGAFLVVVAATGCFCWLRAGRRAQALSSRRHDTLYLTLLTFAMAVLYAVIAALLFPIVSPDQRLLIAIIVAGLISGGALGRATVPPAAATWIITLNIGAIIGLRALSADLAGVTICLLLLYDVTVLSGVISLARALADRLQAEAVAFQQEQVVGLLLRDFEAHASNWLWECDRDGRLTRVSERMAQVVGQAAGKLLDSRLLDLLVEDHPAARPADLVAQTTLSQRLAGEIPFRDHVAPVLIRGELRWWTLSAKPITDRAGHPVGWRGVGADITEARRAEEKLLSLANQDGLTGLTNRHRFRGLLQERSERDTHPFALILIDLDNFKAVNDTLGHATGDALLRLLAHRFAVIMRDGAEVARLGGDEFAVLLLDSEAAGALSRSRTLLAGLHEPCLIGDVRIEAHASIGVAVAPEHGATADALFAHADAALYAAKEAGGDRIHLFDDALRRRLQQRRILLRDISDALDHEQFSLRYQPQFDLNSGKVTSFEALLRWNHPDRGLVGPDQFIPRAEESGQIIPIGAWALEQACRDALQWPSTIKVAVNLSAVQLNSRSVLTMVAGILARTGFPPTRLELEITESALINDAAAARATLDSLRDLQIEIALDDFGTGYSMLSYLRAFPFNKLKIDHSFVAPLTDNGDSSHLAIFRAITDLAAALDLRTVAEGVDSRAKLQAVRQQGCHVIQGYLIAKPMPASEIDDFLASLVGLRLA